MNHLCSYSPLTPVPAWHAIAARRRLLLLFSFPLLLISAPLHAQVGIDNPGGPAGIFNGNLEVGVDPYTGNAIRSITDISIAGAVSPLSLTRIYNSRDPTGAHFGSNGWHHSYEWTIDPSGNLPGPTFPPAAYVVNFPDGRRETFQFVTWDCGGNPWICYYRVSGRQGGVDSSAGVRERFQQLNMTSLLCYLILPDGGKVEFQAARHNAGNNLYYYTYKTTAIIDPYGLRTSISYDTSGRMNQVTEPAGRYLQFYYRTSPTNSQLIDHVSGSDRRSVYYYYITSAYSPGTTQYIELNQVAYFNQWNAIYKYCVPNANGVNGIPLLSTADDPMYVGPMKRVAYQYMTANNLDGSPAAYGQIYKVRYWDGTTQNAGNGVEVSTLDVTATNTRKETRGDGKWRTFTYGAANTNMTGHLVSCTDFMYHISASQGYDDHYYYINYVTDRNGYRTDYTLNALTGNVVVTTFPLTSDTPGQMQRPTIQYAYGSNDCQDPNNRDATMPYYLCTATDEGGHITKYWRDTNHRITRVDYPDGGYETFSYDPSHFYQLQSHRMVSGGTENWTYDSRHRKDTYRNPDNASPSASPSAQYYYDTLDRVSSVHDALNHATDYQYNDRGQLALTTLPWFNGTRYYISNIYNNDGTLQSTTDQLNHTTTYTYDDYRRLKSVTPPARGDGTGSHTTSFYYGANPWDGVNDYKYIDSNVTYVVPPSTGTKKIHTGYDDNRRKSLVTLAPGTADEANSSYIYDAVGNVTWVTDPGTRWVITSYDERNRPSSINDYGRSTTFTYDTAGRRKTITRPNGQTITYDSFDEMNRITQQTATQTPEPNAVTKYTYYAPGEGPVGLLHTMQDPHLVAMNSSGKYEYFYDSMGRKTWVYYPKDYTNAIRAEGFTYDAVGRLQTFRNRNGNYQTFSYDQLNRMSGFTWDDGGVTPSVSFGYDAASRLTEIDNANATVSRAYWDDNSLRSETETPTGGVARAVSYAYDADGNLASLAFPGYTFDYTYTNRNQVKWIDNDSTGAHQAYYEYDARGSVTLRNAYTSPIIASNYGYDIYERVTSITHTLNNATRTFSYGYDDAHNSDDRLWAKRGITPTSSENNKGEAFSYDRADQAIAFALNVANPQSIPQPLPRNINYDANGNRTNFQAVQYGAANNLSQYTTRTGGTTAAYDLKGNMTTALDGSTYYYDAQNRLLTATKNGVMMSFAYDGLNRQVSRTAGGPNTYSTWDGWNLVEEYTNNPSLVIQARYLYGPTGVVKELQNNRYYCQEGSGSTALLADSTAHLLEWYRYDLQGTPIVYDASDHLRSPNQSIFGVRHLFTGQQWYKDIGLYDLRNRLYSPDIGRFLQPDPSGFSGDSTNLYRYAGNNPVTSSDPMGLDAVPHSGGYYTYVAYWPWARLVGSHIVNGSEWLQCAGAARFLGGGYVNGVYYNMPITRYWYQGAMLSTATGPGTVVATGWGLNGGYPSKSVDQYSAGQTINHTLVFEYWDKDGNAHLFSQNPGGSIHETIVNEDDAWQYNEVYVDKSNGAYESTPSTRSVAEGNGASGYTGINTRVPSIIGGIFYPYGFGNRSPNLNFGEGRAGTILGAFSWSMNDAFLTGVLNWGDVGRDMYANPIGAMEPGIGPGSCFVAGTPVLMADGSEKPIESIQIGELVLAWNEETKQVFSTKVIKALHHNKKMETLFDIELEDGRKLTVNNDHPMYVIEDGDFKFTDELAARFAKGETITLQDNRNQPVKIVSMPMHKEMCKMYNLHVEGQGKNGHTYYANGILVHNAQAGDRLK